MDAAAGGGEEEEFVTYAEIEAYFNHLALEGPSAQERIDRIVPHLISLLPPPFVPAPDADDSSGSDYDHFSLTSSEDEAAAPADGFAVVRAAQDGDGQDHISRLPDDLLSNIVSCLPTNEAARTMVLSTRWRCVWAATPLLVDDAHLSAADGPRNFNAVRALSHCVAAHPGPVRAVRVTRTSFHRQEYALQRLLASLAAKNVQDLVLFNRPWPLDMPLPDEILRCASLTRLYIGVWRFPDTTAHQPAFPNLHELGLFHSIIEDRDVDALLAHCPKLKILSFAITYSCRSRLRIKSSSLRVVMEWRCGFDEIIVEDAPCLERLLFESISDRRPVRIVHAPRLEVLSFLDLRVHALEIGGIVIRAGMNVRARAMLPSLKMLAVRVRFSHDMDVKMLDPLLRCFPRLETLHVMSIRSSSPDGVACGEFWKSLGSCDCLESHLKTFVFHRFRGLDCECEYLFLCYILKKGKVLKMLGLDCADSDDAVMEGGPVSGSFGEGNAPTGGSSVNDVVVVEGGPMSGSSVGGNVSSGGSSGSDDVVVEGGPMPGSAGEGNVSSGGSSGSDDVVMEGGPVSGSVDEGDAPSAGSTGRNIIHVYPASPSWSFQNAIDLSVEDPFCVLRHDEVWIASRVLA